MKKDKKLKEKEKKSNKKVKPEKEKRIDKVKGKKKKKKAINKFVKDNELKKLKKENTKLKKQLEKQLDQAHIKDEMVFQQSRFAIMGEMIGNIAHQWRQPLMEMSTLFMKEEAKIKLLDEIDKDDVLDTISQSNNILRFMSDTIDDFKNFFATNKEKEEFYIAKQISSAIGMMNNTLKRNNIKVNIFIKSNTKLKGYSNEYTQIIINIVSNAKDIILSRGITEGVIILKVYEEEGNSILEIEDNGGGIECEPIEKVFESFFTYGKKNGTGIGLFMSKLIIENNMNGSLSVQNSGNGACFKIITPM